MESLAERITRHEGIKLAPYRDNQGHLTIGIGRNLDAEGISHDEAIYMLDNDIKNVQQQTAKAMPWILGIDDERQEVIYEMVFQLGINGVLQFQKMLAAIRQGDFKTASQEMLNSQWYQQTPQRCEELADIMLNGSAT